jgi:hypothetical protein
VIRRECLTTTTKPHRSCVHHETTPMPANQRYGHTLKMIDPLLTTLRLNDAFQDGKRRNQDFAQDHEISTPTRLLFFQDDPLLTTPLVPPAPISLGRVSIRCLALLRARRERERKQAMAHGHIISVDSSGKEIPFHPFALYPGAWVCNRRGRVRS